MQRARNRQRCGKPDNDPDAAAREAERHGLDQKLTQDVARTRAHRAPDPDLARPLSHRQQHDVHDADAADQQRHRGRRRQERSHRAARAVEGFAQLFECDFLQARDVANDRARDFRTQPAVGQRLPRLRGHREIIRGLHADAMTRA